VSGGSPLRDSAFRRLAWSYGLNELGDNFALIALAVLVFDETNSALATAGLFIAAKFAPAFVAPALTARTDRMATRRVLPVLYSTEAATFALLAVIAAKAFSLPAVLALAFIDGTIALTARGLSRAAVAAVLGPSGTLRAGNSELNVIFSVASAAGPAVAGLVVAATSTSVALAVDAGSFATVALLLGTARTLPPAALERDEHWLSRLRGGISYLRSNSALRMLIGAQGAAFVFFTLVTPIEVVYAKETLSAGDLGFGVLVGAWGAGMIMGSWLFARWRDIPTALLVGASTLAVGAGYLGMAIAPSIEVACLAAAVGGIGNGVQWIAVVTAVQEEVLHEYQARIVGLLESVAAAAPGVGFVLGGILASVWSPRTAFVVAGVGVVLVAAAMTRRLALAPTPRPAAE
jgi:MFS family permease